MVSIKQFLTFIMVIGLTGFVNKCVANTHFSVSLKMSGDNERLPDSILVRYTHDYYLGNEKFIDHVLYPDSSGVFSLKTQVPERIGIVGFYVYTHEDNMLINGVSDFFAFPGDDVLIMLSEEDHAFSGHFLGKGCAKYRCKSKLADLRNAFYENQLSYMDSLEAKFDFTNTLIEMGSLFIDSYKEELEDHAFQLLQVDNFSFYHTQWIANVMYNYRKDMDQIAWQKAFEAYGNLYAYSLFDIELASLSYYFILKELDEIQFQLLLRSEGEGYDIRRQYEEVKKNYDGTMRERLLLACLDNYRGFRHVIDFQPEDFISCVEDAMTVVKDSYLNASLAAILLLKSGVAVFNFTLPDPHGMKVSLSDLAGKVVLLDMWGSGCTGCASFYRRFKADIYPAFKDNEHFKVVSVNIDKTEAQWLKEIDSGRYTDSGHINLFTMGKGMDHPLAQFYNLRSVPFILLIDKEGRVYSKIEIGFSSERIRELIAEAIAKQS